MELKEVLQALESLGVKMTAIAEKSKVSKQAISMVKNGHNIDFNPETKAALDKAVTSMLREFEKLKNVRGDK